MTRILLGLGLLAIAMGVYLIGIAPGTAFACAAVGGFALGVVTTEQTQA